LDAPWHELAVDAESVRDVPAPSAEVAVPVDRGELQALMWDAAGLYRDEAQLTAAAGVLAGRSAASASLTDRETGNLLDIARVVVAAALARHESRGAHFRSDFPATNPAEARHASWARKVTVPC